MLEEQSLSSAVSLEQMSTSRAPSEAEADGPNAKLSIRASFCLLSDPVSPPQAFSTSSFNTQETANYHLAVPLQKRFSTPNMLLQRQNKSACFDQSYGDLNATQMSWDVSLIKREGNRPKPYMESSTLEQTWSPIPQPSEHSHAEVSLG